MRKLFYIKWIFVFFFSIQCFASNGIIIEKQPLDFFVRWKSSVSQLDIKTFHEQAKTQVVWNSSLVPNLQRVIPSDIQQLKQSISLYKNNPNILYAEPNYRIQRILPKMDQIQIGPLPYLNTPINDPYYQQQWALVGSNGIQVQDAWEITTGSSDIKVAVIDTGADPNHDELSDRLLSGYDFISRTDRVSDPHGHGSHVSGVIGARTNNQMGIAGINHNVTIIPIRAVPSNGDETDANVIASFEYAVEKGARVANCSFGKYASSQAVGDTIEAAGEHGLLTVVAAGNDGRNNASYNVYPANFRTSNMIVVAATVSSGPLAYFSNYGKTMVDVAAPGASIYSSVRNGRYAAWSGTSMASPQVAGVAALVLSVNPELTTYELKDILLQNVTKVAVFEQAIITGGRIDAAKAVAAANLH